MRRHTLLVGLVLVMLAAFPLISFGEGDKFGEIKSPDGALSLKVLELKDEHGVAHFQGKVKNVSEQDLKNITLTINTYEGTGASASVDVGFEELKAGQLTIFEATLQGKADLVNKIEIGYKVSGGEAY